MSSTTETSADSWRNRFDSASSSLLFPAVAAIVGHLVLIMLGITAYLAATGSWASNPPAGVLYATSGLALIISVAVLWWYLSPEQREAAFPLHRLSRAELGWTLVFVPLGLLAFLGGEQLGIAVGGEPIEFAYDVTEPATFLGVLFGAILVAPLAEELLYRGALIRALEDRDWSVLAVGAGSIIIFAVAHVFALGVTGVFAIAGVAVFPTVLRLRFENVTGAWLHHLLNNVVAYLLIPLLFV